MKQYVKSNIDFLHTWMAEHLPQIKVTKTEGTYLVWMDFRALGLSDKELKELIEDKAEVWLDGGAIFESLEVVLSGSTWLARERRLWKRWIGLKKQ